MAKKDPLKATLTEREDLTDSLALFRFELQEGVPDFEPGQFVMLGLPNPEKEGKTLWRAYSIASPPERKECLELYIRWAQRPVPGKFTTMLWPLQPGAVLDYKPPRGHFTIERSRPDGEPDTRRMVLLGGGTGIAPFVSYIEHLRAHGSTREIVVCHGASYIEELGYRERLLELEQEAEAGGREAWNLRYLASISRPKEEANAGWDGHVGRVETLVSTAGGGGLSPAELACGTAFTPDDTTFYICGFDGTIQAVKSVLQSRDFRTPKEAREDGSYEIKFESYG